MGEPIEKPMSEITPIDDDQRAEMVALAKKMCRLGGPGGIGEAIPIACGIAVLAFDARLEQAEAALGGLEADRMRWRCNRREAEERGARLGIGKSAKTMLGELLEIEGALEAAKGRSTEWKLKRERKEILERINRIRALDPAEVCKQAREEEKG